MDQEQNQQQHQAVENNGEITNGNPPYPPAPTTSPGVPMSSQQQIAYQQSNHIDRQQKRLQSFWANQMAEAEQATDFKNHSLPLARVKKIMKADEDVRMISSEAPVLFAKACEMFISDLTLRAWMHTEENKRRTLQKNDVAAAISRTDTFDFLVDILPRDETNDDVVGLMNGPTVPLVGPAGDQQVPYYYVQQQQQVVGPNGAAVFYGGGQQLPQASGFVPWPQMQQPQQQNDTQN